MKDKIHKKKEKKKNKIEKEIIKEINIYFNAIKIFFYFVTYLI